ncbi:uncharacterized protein LOC141599043 [Silene latifolia]|uniref:uncharacterized protein LOC141599043 n=1 Tax=Silene latifolia TaxID=37657 RepID=UPI003D77A754
MCQNSDDEETEGAIFYRTRDFVEQDNKHEFVGLINRLDSNDKKGILLKISMCDAANCLRAVFDGEAALDERFIKYYISSIAKNRPLHHAACLAKPRIASLLLEKGFSADLRTNFKSPHICMKNALPLNIALEYCRYCVWLIYGWKSPIHQIIIPCQQPPTFHPKTIRVMARNTTEIKHEFLKYLEQGKVFEVGALLAIASDLIMSSSSTIDVENASIGFKNIMEMRQFLLARISRSLGASSNTQLKEIKNTLRLLEIFDRIGDKLLPLMLMWDDSTSEVGNRVASLIEKAAYDEKVEVEYDHDAVLRYCNTSKTLLDDVKPTWELLRGRSFGNCTRKFSTKAHSQSWLEERSSPVVVPLPLPTEGRFLAWKGARTKYVLLKKHASFIGALAKAVRHLQYL